MLRRARKRPRRRTPLCLRSTAPPRNSACSPASSPLLRMPYTPSSSPLALHCSPAKLGLFAGLFSTTPDALIWVTSPLKASPLAKKILGKCFD